MTDTKVDLVKLSVPDALKRLGVDPDHDHRAGAAGTTRFLARLKTDLHPYGVLHQTRLR
jgi:hypothetical protein